MGIENGPLPPGPDLPAEDQARLWLERPVELLEAARRAHGEVFSLDLGNFGRIVIVADPEAAAEAFDLPAGSFECRHFNASYGYVMGPSAPFLQDGAGHRRIRRILAPRLSGDLMGPQGARIVRAARASLPEAGPLPLRPFTHEIALRALLGFALGAEDARAEAAVGWFRDTAWRDLRSWKPWTAMSRLRPRLHTLIAEEIAARRAGQGAGKAPDLLASLMAARDAEGAPLTEAEIEDQIRMLTVTAGDAVAVALAWALYRAARHPEWQDRLRDEAADLGPDPDPATLAAQPQLAAFCAEVLRLHPVLPTVSGRRLTEARTFRGWQLPAGVTLAPCEYLTHRRADLFDDPLAFRPERFLAGTGTKPGYFPFGAGPRACLGSVLAPLTVKLALATVLGAYRLTDPNPETPRTLRHGTLLAPEPALSVGLFPLERGGNALLPETQHSTVG